MITKPPGTASGVRDIAESASPGRRSCAMAHNHRSAEAKPVQIEADAAEFRPDEHARNIGGGDDSESA
jgi:hypothetical protein